MLHLERVDDEERSSNDHNGDDENPTPIFQIEAGHVSLPEVMVVLEGMQERDKLGVYRGFGGEAIFWANDGETPPFDAPCLSHECAAWMAAFVWRRFQAFLRASEVRQLCLVLAGRAPDAVPAWVQKRDDLALLDKSPTVAAVVAFMEWQSTATVEMRVAILWVKLHAIAKEHGLLKIGPHRFPAGPASLSRRLSQEWSVLARFGITGRIWRSDGAHVRLTRDPDADAWESPASETSSAPKPAEDSGFDEARTPGRDFATSPAHHPRNHRGVVCVPRGEEDDDD